MKTEAAGVEPGLVPILRQGIDVVKMVLFVELKPVLTLKYPGMDEADIGLLAGAAVNRLFGVQNLEAKHVSFEKENRERIAGILKNVAVELDHLRIPLTDALRMQFFCDRHEGVNSTSVLKKAEALKILIMEREAPLPGAFMSVVRSFGVAYKILKPQKAP